MSYYENTKNKKFSNFFIVEFSAEQSVEQVLNLAQHSEGDGTASAVPVYSPFLWFQSPVSSPSNKATKTRPVLEQMVRHMFDPSERNRSITFGNTMI